MAQLWGGAMQKLLFWGLVILTVPGCASGPEGFPAPPTRSPANGYCAANARQRADDAADNGIASPVQRRIFNDVEAACLQERARMGGSP